MRAIAVTPSNRTVDLIADHPEPRLARPTDVRIRVLDVGVCGTDKEICAFEYGTPPAGSERLVIGHESLGEVVEVGSAVTRVKAGDLVVPSVRRPCGRPECLACAEGRQDFCYTGAFTERGIKGAHGYMTEQVVEDERYLNVLPRGLREVGVLVEPLTIAAKALAQVKHVQARLPWGLPDASGERPARRHTAVVLGAGPVGLLGAMALVNAGFETYVYSRSPAPNAGASLCELFGAHYVSSSQVSVDDLAARVGNIDLVYEAVGASSLAFDVMRVLGTNGIFVFTGVPGRKAPIEVDTDLIMRNLVLKNQVVFGSVNAGIEAFEAAVQGLGAFLDRWPQATRALITGRYPMDAYHDLLLGKPTGIKNVLAIAG